MWNKKIRFYRLKSGLSQQELGQKIGVSAMTISYYESGKRRPSLEKLKALAAVFNVRVFDLMNARYGPLSFDNLCYRPSDHLSEREKELIAASVEEYLSRFYTIVEILGDQVLPPALPVHAVKGTGLDNSDPDKDARALRQFLNASLSGPIENLVRLLERNGILLIPFDSQCSGFTCMSGCVNERPFIVFNSNMKPASKRFAMAQELFHLFFQWEYDLPDSEIDGRVRAFLLPAEDAVLELGIRRKHVSGDMKITGEKYGISMYDLAQRASDLNIISDHTCDTFRRQADQWGWKVSEPVSIKDEHPALFRQLVYRAVCEEEISVQKGIELLNESLEEIISGCYFDEYSRIMR